MDDEYQWQAVATIIGLFILVTAIAVVVIWQRSASSRAAAVLAREKEYQKLSENGVVTQQTTERQLTEIVTRLNEMQGRMEALERILRDVD